MKNLKFLFLLAVVPFFAACSSDDDDNNNGNNTAIIEEGAYVGTLKVDQNDDTFYNQDNVKVEIEFDEGTAKIIMHQVSFSERMPVKLDMTIPGVTANAITGGFEISGNNIVPLAGGGQFAQYTITDMSGTITTAAISFELTCGAYPLTFTGIYKEQ